jgi:hypothetical protein
MNLDLDILRVTLGDLVLQNFAAQSLIKQQAGELATLRAEKAEREPAEKMAEAVAKNNG